MPPGINNCFCVDSMLPSALSCLYQLQLLERFAMGFVLSILYFVTYYLDPATLFGSLAVYRIWLIIAVLVFLISLPALTRSFVLKTPQSLALSGLPIAGALSVLITMHWLAGAAHAFLTFIPAIFAYFLVCLHFDKKKKLNVIVLMLLFVCLFVIANGSIDLLHEVSNGGTRLSVDTGSFNADQWNLEHPYLMASDRELGESTYRLRGLGEINDPNDFGQMIVCVIPLMFLLWRPKKLPRNIAFVILPICVLILGVYLTHSRGALVALMAIVIVAAYRRFGLLPSLVLTGTLFAAALALHFTGGRDISVSAGVDRTSLWGQGMSVLRAHPLFGVGLGNLEDYTDTHQTAHNSIVICAAELGMFGMFFWCIFLFSTVRDALVMSSTTKVNEGVHIASDEDLFPRATRTVEQIDKEEVNRFGHLLVLSLTGLLVAGLFLSRAFVLTLFLLGGMVEVVYQMALQRGMIVPRMRLVRLMPYSAALAVFLVIALYIALRIMNLMR